MSSQSQSDTAVPTIRVVNVHDFGGGLETAARYFHREWGSAGNLAFYLDAITHAAHTKLELPRFYLLLKDDAIIGSYALLVNDFISRHDLLPWFACLFVEPAERGQRHSQRLFDHARREAARAGYDTLYLTTDHIGLYEKFGWKRMEDGYDPFGNKTRIYKLEIEE